MSCVESYQTYQYHSIPISLISSSPLGSNRFWDSGKHTEYYEHDCCNESQKCCKSPVSIFRCRMSQLHTIRPCSGRQHSDDWCDRGHHFDEHNGDDLFTPGTKQASKLLVVVGDNTNVVQIAPRANDTVACQANVVTGDADRILTSVEALCCSQQSFGRGLFKGYRPCRRPPETANMEEPAPPLRREPSNLWDELSLGMEDERK